MSSDQEILDIHSQKKGKLEVVSTVKIDSKETLSQVYTPGVGKVCMAIKNDSSKAKELTIAGKMVAVVSDGSAVLGFGNIGPEAALPVMEGKAAIFKEFAGVDAFPICLDTQDTEEIIKTVKLISPNFAAIELEDISAPRCFEIEERLQEELDIPVMHDDQHGTAIVTLAAMMGAIELTKKKGLKIVIVGAGAAGVAITKLLKVSELDINSIKLVDSKGVVAKDRTDLNKYKAEMAELTNQDEAESLEQALIAADIFIGVSAKDLLTQDMIKNMGKNPIILAMANPDPEILPHLAQDAGASIVATGRSDFPNQINNALVYPGVFKGLLESGANSATDEIKLAAARAVFNYHKNDLSIENLLPSILDKKVPELISRAIVEVVRN